MPWRWLNEEASEGEHEGLRTSLCLRTMGIRQCVCVCVYSLKVSGGTPAPRCWSRSSSAVLKRSCPSVSLICTSWFTNVSSSFRTRGTGHDQPVIRTDPCVVPSQRVGVKWTPCTRPSGSGRLSPRRTREQVVPIHLPEPRWESLHL